VTFDWGGTGEQPRAPDEKSGQSEGGGEAQREDAGRGVKRDGEAQESTGKRDADGITVGNPMGSRGRKPMIREEPRPSTE